MSNAVTTIVSGLNGPSGVALDGAGNVYFADTGNNAIKEWVAAVSNVIILVPGLNGPSGVALDGAGNVYFADTGNNAVKEWSVTTGSVATLTSQLNGPFGVAVDAAGNVYIADSGNNAVKEWSPANGMVTPLVVSGLNGARGVAVDATGNVYIADTTNNAVKELPYAFVAPTSWLETANPGTNALPVVLPASENLLAPFAPATSDTAWLAISGISNGVVSFSFSVNYGTTRSAYVTLLGQTNLITQSGPSYSLSTTNLLVGPNPGTNIVVLAIAPSTLTWTATANATWLHLCQKLRA